MCGIFGIINKKDSIENSKIQSMSDELFKLSASRGKESSGFSVYADDVISVYKKSLPSSQIINDAAYKSFFKKENLNYFTIIGHSRLATQGSLNANFNNQPVVKNGLICIHNGIIVNDKILWNKYKALTKKYDVDTEIFLELVSFFSKKYSFCDAIIKTFQEIKGTASIAIFSKLHSDLILGTNNGSLYICDSIAGDSILFASERYILEASIKKNKLSKEFSPIIKVQPNKGYIINIKTLDKTSISLDKKTEDIESFCENIKLESPAVINDLSDYSLTVKSKSTAYDYEQFMKELEEYYNKTKKKIDKIQRCKRCVLPSTMPFISFNTDGVCNYCLNYKKIHLKGEDGLLKILNKHKSGKEENDCIVSFSGGRDSSYALHYVKNILKMNPVAYSYDWGMITDLGRRNQARMCGNLGIEHILVSADIKRKRENIKKNITAWLKEPDLGMIPLFMAGDKQYFYYLNKLKKNMRIPLVIYGENPIEKTEFKYGFCGVRPMFNSDDHGYNLGIARKFKLGLYYLKQVATNPSYINSSLFNSITAFFSSYFMSHNYCHLFQYVNWSEDEIDSILVKKYEWEKANDTQATWRIGDGTAPFYNYIYYIIAGLTENDTFRSNQVREGVISREVALQLSNRDNAPRWESIKWYCDTIGIDFKNTMESINKIQKLF